METATNFATIAFELSSLVLYPAVIMSCLRRGDARAVARILTGSAFGILLEVSTILFFKTYSYSPHFLLQVFSPPHNVPLCVGLYWGLIIHACMSVSDRIGLREWSRPCLDALLALTIDLSIDAIAIRLDGGYWRWSGIPAEASATGRSYFGVHYGNFVGWFFVVLIFSTLLRFEHRILSERLRIGRVGSAVYMTAIPFLGSVLLCVAIVVSALPVLLLDQFLPAIDFTDEQLLSATILAYLCGLSGVVQVIAWYRARPRVQKDVDWVALTVFGLFHLGFLGLYLAEGLYATAPLIMPVGVAMLLLDALVHWMILDTEKLSRVVMRRFQTEARRDVPRLARAC